MLHCNEDKLTKHNTNMIKQSLLLSCKEERNSAVNKSQQKLIGVQD